MAPWVRCVVALATATTATLGVGEAAECDVGIVGGGPGGAYTAWRAAASGRSVCLFELADRPGGRIHSLRGLGPKKDLVVEAGGYRFAPEPVVQHMGQVTWTIDTPLTAAIVKELNLPVGIYNPNASEWDHGMRKIVDSQGEDAGFLTFIERMLQLAEGFGAKVRFNSRVVGLGAGPTGPSDGVHVHLESGEMVVARNVVLNLPQNPLVELLRNSGGPIASVFPRPLYSPVSFPLLKLYVHYDDAWWRNDLGRQSGLFYNLDKPSEVPSHIPNLAMEGPAPLQGMYHDGHVRCDLPGGRCRGFLQAYYGHDYPQYPGGMTGAIQFFAPFLDSVSGDSAQLIGDSLPHHRAFLEALHAALVEFHRTDLDAANATERVAAMRPTEAVLSIWSQGVTGIHAGCHMPKRHLNGSNPVPGELAKAALQPLPGWPVYVANEAYGTMMCFAEGSLAMAEAALRSMGIPLPPTGWLTEELSSGLLEPQASAGRPPTDPFFLAGMLGSITGAAESRRSSAVPEPTSALQFSV